MSLAYCNFDLYSLGSRYCSFHPTFALRGEMRRSLFVFCSGSVFGFRIAVSGILKPSKIAGFPDLFGAG